MNRSAIYLRGTNMDFPFYLHIKISQFSWNKGNANFYIVSVSILNRKLKFRININLLIDIAVMVHIGTFGTYWAQTGIFFYEKSFAKYRRHPPLIITTHRCYPPLRHHASSHLPHILILSISFLCFAIFPALYLLARKNILLNFYLII